MGFEAHGEVSIEVRGQIIISYVTGPWNIELVQLSRKMIYPHLANVSAQGNWGLIVQVSGSVLCPPDALQLIREGANQDISSTKRICTSYLISPQTEGYNLMLPICHNIYRGKVPFDIFVTLQDAISWTNEQLAVG